MRTPRQEQQGHHGVFVLLPNPRCTRQPVRPPHSDVSSNESPSGMYDILYDVLVC
jgi:hypothetical protein